MRENFLLFFLYSVLLYMKKLSNAGNHSNKLMLTYFFHAVFINVYFKTKHSNETFHLGFYQLSIVWSYRKPISSKSNISVLTISSKSRNIKIIAPFPYFIVNPSRPPFYGIVSIFTEGHFIVTLPFSDIFPEHSTPPAYSTPPPPPFPPVLQLSTVE